MYTRGSSIRSLTVCRRSAAIAGVCTVIGGTSGPRLSGPKYFSISRFVAAGSMSPTTARLALLGA